MTVLVLLSLMTLAASNPSNENLKDEYCTDPRTMEKHQAYSEWADAYSCTRHRCQPGGRKLAVYTVGCKRVEAPESAIECEEVVEDTNMQFPFCCTRLRCLVVVRGEVWTRVLGQPWETLPAAPWSHMYKMKKPPPEAGSISHKITNEGPIYELTSDAVEAPLDADKVLRTNKRTTATPNCNEVAHIAAPTPDIVIALSTDNNLRKRKNSEQIPKKGRKRRARHGKTKRFFGLDEVHRSVDVDNNEAQAEEVVKAPVEKSEHHEVAWTDVPLGQWKDVEHEDAKDKPASALREGTTIQPEFPPIDENPSTSSKDENPTNLQALVDAIGSRMKDIENVVQKMSARVQTKPDENAASGESVPMKDDEAPLVEKQKKNARGNHTKKANLENHYKRFTIRNRGSKYLRRNTETTTEQPLFQEDHNMNGYFSDAANAVLRRLNDPKEQPMTYMAPVENKRKNADPDVSEEGEKKKYSHKKKIVKGKKHKKHHKEEKKKHASNSEELDKNDSMDDSSVVAS